MCSSLDSVFSLKVISDHFAGAGSAERSLTVVCCTHSHIPIHRAVSCGRSLAAVASVKLALTLTTWRGTCSAALPAASLCDRARRLFFVFFLCVSLLFFFFESSHDNYSRLHSHALINKIRTTPWAGGTDVAYISDMLRICILRVYKMVMFKTDAGNCPNEIEELFWQLCLAIVLMKLRNYLDNYFRVYLIDGTLHLLLIFIFSS